MEDYKKKYEDALNAARKFKNDCPSLWDTESNPFRNVFEELKESEDEKISKALIHLINEQDGFLTAINGISVKDVIAWLEKQGEKSHCNGEVNDETLQKQLQIWFDKGKCSGRDEVIFHPENFGLQKQCEQKTIDKVEPKFHEGEWITIDNPCQIISIDGNYIVQYCDDEKTREISKKFCESQFHLWTIQDAKDGDMIYVSTEEKGIQAIFKSYDDNYIYFHCYLCQDFNVDGWLPIGDIKLIYPLQKIHYNRFFQKMKEAGYEWDTKKKELKKIEQKTAWSEEDDYILNLVSKFTSKGYKPHPKIPSLEFVQDWLKSLKERMKGE